MSNIKEAIRLLKMFKAGYVHIESSQYEHITNVVDALESEPEPGEFTKKLHIKWHGMTVQIKPEKAPVSASLSNELMRDLREACDIIDRQASEVVELKMIVLRVDYYCRAEDIDMEQFLKET